MERITAFLSAVGLSDEEIVLFAAAELSPAPGTPDEGELVQAEIVAFEGPASIVPSGSYLRCENDHGRWHDLRRQMVAGGGRPMLSATGVVLIRSVNTAGRAVQLLSQTFWHISTLRLSFRQLLRHLDMAAVGSLGVLALIAALTGMIMVMQTGPSLEPMGVIDVIGGIVGVTFMREMAPLWAAIIILARVGSAMAAELGTMVVNEVDALEVMDIDPVRYLVVPRLIALIARRADVVIGG